MDNVIFEIGNRIELTHIRSAAGRKLSEEKFGSQVLDFDGVMTVKIAMPIFKNKVVPVETGDDYMLCFFTNSGLYQCTGTVRKRYIENKIYVMDVLFLTELKKYQRRKFYRLECMFSIQYRIVSKDEVLLLESLKKGKWDSPEQEKKCQDALGEIEKEWQEATISDLSGGGIRFHGSKEASLETMLEVMLPLSLQNGIIPLKIMTRVVSCVRHNRSQAIYEVRGEFQNLSDDDREIVVKYVFDEQRRRMRKER